MCGFVTQNAHSETKNREWEVFEFHTNCKKHLSHAFQDWMLMQDIGDRAFYTVFCDLWPASLFRCATASPTSTQPSFKLVFNVTLVSGACNNIVLLLNKIFYSSQESSLQLTILLLLKPRKIKAICFKPIWNWGSNKTWSFIMLFIIQNAVRETKNKLLSFMSIVCLTKRKKANDACNIVVGSDLPLILSACILRAVSFLA